MPFLVRWIGPDMTATLKCEHIKQNEVFPNHVRLLGVHGVSDPDHPDLQIHTMDVRKDSVDYISEALYAKKEEPVAQQVQKKEIEKITEKKKKPKTRRKLK